MKKTPLEIAKQIQQDNPKMAGTMNEKKIAKIIKAAFTQVKKEIENTENNIVKIPVLGNFRVQTVERDKEGKKTTVKRVFFKPAKAKK